jgi:hypothetical protein
MIRFTWLQFRPQALVALGVLAVIAVAREFETGAFRLAWTQGITRTRWLAIKLGLVGAFSMAAAGLLTLMVTWWSSPFDTATMDRLNPANFHSEGIVPVGSPAGPSRLHRAGHQGLRGASVITPGVPRLHHQQPAPPANGDLPALEPLLAPSVV